MGSVQDTALDTLTKATGLLFSRYIYILVQKNYFQRCYPADSHRYGPQLATVLAIAFKQPSLRDRAHARLCESDNFKLRACSAPCVLQIASNRLLPAVQAKASPAPASWPVVLCAGRKVHACSIFDALLRWCWSLSSYPTAWIPVVAVVDVDVSCCLQDTRNKGGNPAAETPAGRIFCTISISSSTAATLPSISCGSQQAVTTASTCLKTQLSQPSNSSC